MKQNLDLSHIGHPRQKIISNAPITDITYAIAKRERKLLAGHRETYRLGLDALSKLREFKVLVDSNRVQTYEQLDEMVDAITMFGFHLLCNPLDISAESNDHYAIELRRLTGAILNYCIDLEMRSYIFKEAAKSGSYLSRTLEAWKNRVEPLNQIDDAEYEVKDRNLEPKLIESEYKELPIEM